MTDEVSPRLKHCFPIYGQRKYSDEEFKLSRLIILFSRCWILKVCVKSSEAKKVSMWADYFFTLRGAKMSIKAGKHAVRT